MPKLAVVSLGCPKNLVDTEIMLGRLIEDGWELTLEFEEAELILINTCGFIESAKEESINQILEMAAYKQKGVGVCKKLVASGCLVQRYLPELIAEIPEVDYWIGLHQISQIAEIVQNRPTLETDQSPFLNNQNLTRYRVTLKHTAFVKIAEGCNHCCSYCAIPIIKGGFRSRELGSIVNEIGSLVESGVKEINIIAQDITMYGSDLPGDVNLKKLLEEIVSKAHPEWIRLLYAYPAGLDEELLRFMHQEPSICKYLDLPIQHINARILKLMNRHDSPDFIKERLYLIRSLVPGIVLRTTFIVGFPSETDEEFNELLEFVKEGHFEHVGVFAYSREEQTKAYGLEPQIENSLKEKRRRLLMSSQQKNSEIFLQRQINQEQWILVDKVLKDGKAVGRTAAFAPEVDGVVYLDNYHGKPGEFVKSLITGHDIYNLLAGNINK